MDESIQNELIKSIILEEREKLPRTLTPQQVSEILDWGRSKTYEELRRADGIPAKKVRGKLIINRDLFLIWFYTTTEENGSDITSNQPFN